MQKKTNYTKKNKKSTKKNFTVVNPNAAGIDIRGKVHYVSVPDDRDSKPIQNI